MTASSVTGIGNGSAEPHNKGAERMTLGVGHLIGTRIVLSGNVTLNDGGSGSVTFAQELEGDASDYIVFLQGDSSTYAFPSNVATTGFDITGGADDVVNWMVVIL